MAFWANAPAILVPGMGVNAFFTYTAVHTLGLTWQEALVAVFISGIIFAIAALHQSLACYQYQFQSH